MASKEGGALFLLNKKQVGNWGGENLSSETKKDILKLLVGKLNWFAEFSAFTLACQGKAEYMINTNIRDVTGSIDGEIDYYELVVEIQNLWQDEELERKRTRTALLKAIENYKSNLTTEIVRTFSDKAMGIKGLFPNAFKWINKSDTSKAIKGATYIEGFWSE